MNPFEMKELMELLRCAVSAFAPEVIDIKLASRWLDLLMEDGLSSEDIERGIRKAAKTCEVWPSIAVVSRLAMGLPLDAKQTGVEVAGKIEYAIGRYGFYNGEGAQKYLGEFGWRIVQLAGGWPNLCSTDDDELASARKRWRELALAEAKKMIFDPQADPSLLPAASDAGKKLIGEALSVIDGGLRASGEGLNREDSVKAQLGIAKSPTGKPASKLGPLIAELQASKKQK